MSSRSYDDKVLDIINLAFDLDWDIIVLTGDDNVVAGLIVGTNQVTDGIKCLTKELSATLSRISKTKDRKKKSFH